MGNVALFIPRGSNNMDKHIEYIPKGFKSWWEYRKWQYACDIIKAIVAFVFLIILCIWVGD